MTQTLQDPAPDINVRTTLQERIDKVLNDFDNRAVTVCPNCLPLGSHLLLAQCHEHRDLPPGCYGTNKNPEHEEMASVIREMKTAIEEKDVRIAELEDEALDRKDG